ncbi:hypothetical protein Pmani_002567 [Petrolisthes manimaculis]|uniref:Uncharacterized protein n=1 Tax=Petrolisthes manimaculis TaxID=1843537 RepID=A0AAE1QHC3_9EUCA|nr:hypothetical protein Pmani_002567 [Petrolisthes manimaculis]
MPDHGLPSQILYGRLPEPRHNTGGQDKRYKDQIRRSMKKCQESLRLLLRTENYGEPLVEMDVTSLRKIGTWPEKNEDSGDSTRTECSLQTQTLHDDCVAKFMDPGLAYTVN